MQPLALRLQIDWFFRFERYEVFVPNIRDVREYYFDFSELLIICVFSRLRVWLNRISGGQTI